MRDEIMIATTADHPVMAFAKPCESEPEQMWIGLKDTAPFEYILGPPSTVLGRTGRRSLREAGVEPLGLDTYLSASFAAAMAREGVGLAFFHYRSCRIMRDEFRYLRIGKDGIFPRSGARLARWKIPLAGGDGAREAVSGDGAGAAEAVSFFYPNSSGSASKKISFQARFSCFS